MYGLMAAVALGPVVVHDSREASPLGSVGSRPGTFAAAPVVYERKAGEWRGPARRLPRQRLACRLLPPRRARPDLAGPHDEADGRGAVIVPRTEPLGPWRDWPGRWGNARAGWVPGEMDSPRGPAFQPQGRWSDPGAWARAARPCTLDRCDETGECDGRETAIALGAPSSPS